jgi:hypothetical protein
MSAKSRIVNRTVEPCKRRHVRRPVNSAPRTVRRTVVTVGDLIAAAYEVGGSAEGAALLLSRRSPLSRLLGRPIVLAA